MIEVRPFAGGDAPLLAKIYLKCRLETFPWVPRINFKLEDFDRDTEGERILVGTSLSVPVGFIAIWERDSFIHHLYVDPDRQGNGYGRILLMEALKTISQPARLKCVVQNSRACEFYEKHGWKIESTTPDGPMGPYHTYVLTEQH